MWRLRLRRTLARRSRCAAPVGRLCAHAGQGLGKSLQTISLLGYLKHYRSVDGPHLLVTPKTTLHNWLNEFNKWCPTINAFILHGGKEDRVRFVPEFCVREARRRAHLDQPCGLGMTRGPQPELIEKRLLAGNFDVCITSYEMVLLEKTALKKIPWQYIIIDEVCKRARDGWGAFWAGSGHSAGSEHSRAFGRRRGSGHNAVLGTARVLGACAGPGALVAS